MSGLEHHSNIVPWQMMTKKNNAKLKVIPLKENGELDLKVFSNSMGIITFSLLISILIKPYILKFVFGNFDINQVRKTSEYISKTSLFQKTSYLLIMFLSHQLIVNFIDIFSFEKLKIIINKTLVSTIISIFFSYIIVLIFFRKNER